MSRGRTVATEQQVVPDHRRSRCVAARRLLEKHVICRKAFLGPRPVLQVKVSCFFLDIGLEHTRVRIKLDQMRKLYND